MSSPSAAASRHVKEGDRVGVPWLYTACGHCEHCLGGWETLCAKQQNSRLFGQWRLRRILSSPIRTIVGHLPDKLASSSCAPVLCAGVTVYKGLKVTDTGPATGW